MNTKIIASNQPTEYNPFINHLLGSFKPKHKAIKTGEIIDHTTGEILPKHSTRVTQPIMSDVTPFMRFYDVAVDSLLVLKPASVKLLALIMKQVSRDCDTVYLAFDTTVNKYMKESAFYNARSELISFGIIAPTDKPNIFWINPLYFYNGNRETLVKKHTASVSLDDYYDINSVQNNGLLVQSGGL